MRNTDSALLRRFFSAALVLLVLAGLAALFLFCGGGALALLGTAQLAGQPDAVSRALQSSPAELQALGRQFLQQQGYASSGLGLLLFHSGLWLVPVVATALCAGIIAFALWRRHTAEKRRQALEATLIAWLDGADFAPPPDCPQTLREAVDARITRQTADLKAARRQAADADRFAQNVYHQIKTPLAVANLLLEELETLSGPASAKAAHCRTELEKISALAHTLLQAGRFDSGTVALRWQPEDLELLAEDVIAELRPLWQARGLHLRLDSPDCGEVHTVLCDAFWLGEALGNILKNCIEQTPPGGKILCRVEYDPTRTRILVQDPGSFLPENTDIFARYATTRAGGVGIGLHLARQIAAAHFGTLTARNLPDGCEFCLTLPVLQGGAPYQKQAAQAVTEL